MVGTLLDTCVLSEMGKHRPNAGVTAAIAEADAQSLYLSVITIGEITKGIELLPLSHRRTLFEQRRSILLEDFDSRVLPVDIDVASLWGEIVARTQSSGILLQAADAYIAATAIRHGLHVMTRNVRHFEPTGAEILNPWTDE